MKFKAAVIVSMFIVSSFGNAAFAGGGSCTPLTPPNNQFGVNAMATKAQCNTKSWVKNLSQTICSHKGTGIVLGSITSAVFKAGTNGSTDGCWINGACKCSSGTNGNGTGTGSQCTSLKSTYTSAQSAATSADKNAAQLQAKVNTLQAYLQKLMKSGNLRALAGQIASLQKQVQSATISAMNAKNAAAPLDAAAASALAALKAAGC